MRWHVRSERSLYRDDWLDVRLADVALPDGRHLDHRVVRVAPGAGAVVLNARREVLLLWRHRFITGSWAYEIPIGGVDHGELPVDAASREVEEETGWRPRNLRPLVTIEPSNGLMDACHHIFVTSDAVYIGPPADMAEAQSVEWVALDAVPGLVAEGQIVGGTTSAALLLALTG